MMTREQFGPYLLLKKLSEDPLGETFRAGRIGHQAMEQVVLLRVFNGSALEGQDLWQQVADRRPVQQALKSPNIGSGVDLGQVQGVPYVAYDYISGKNLANVFNQVAKGSQPMPTEHALLIAERLALGLAVAYETRVEEKRVLHGFLVPQLVLISNEGENRLLGFEVGSGLRQLATSGPLSEVFGRYLSPESLAGEPPAKTDDVYSLGAILLELLAGRALPANDPQGIQSLVLEVTQRGLGEVGYLLGRSLGPVKDRIPEVVSWHKSLSKVLIDGGYRATTFNLAFFMHNLFREEIEKESKEIEVERTIKMPVVPSAPEVAPTDSGVNLLLEPPQSGGPTTETAPLQRPAAAAGSSRRKSKLPLVAAVVLVLAALGGGGYFAWQNYLSPSPSEDGPQVTVTMEPPLPEVFEPLPETGDEEGVTGPDGLDPAADPEAEIEPEQPPGPTPEELLAQIDTIVAERTSSMERSLRQQYDDQIAELQAQLESAKREQEEARQEAERRAELAAQRRAEELRAQKEAAARAARPETGTEREAVPQRTTGGTPPTAVGGTPGTEVAAPSTGSTPAAQPTEASPPRSRAATEQTPRQQAAATTRPQPNLPKPPPRRTRRGELVALDPDVTPPKLSGRLDPRYPVMALKIKKEATVLVSVLVDENGKVLETKLPKKKVGFGFDEAALQAARRARFEPAVKDGVSVKTWTTLRIEFRLQ